MKTSSGIFTALLVTCAVGCGDNVEPIEAPAETYTTIVRAACVAASGARMDPCNSFSRDGLRIFQCSGYVENMGCVTYFYPDFTLEGRKEPVVCTAQCGIAP